MCSLEFSSSGVETLRVPGFDCELFPPPPPPPPQMSIEERLGEIDLSTAAGRKGAQKGGLALQTDSYAVLLVQGLESKDGHILNVSEGLRVFQSG